MAFTKSVNYFLGHPVELEHLTSGILCHHTENQEVFVHAGVLCLIEPEHHLNFHHKEGYSDLNWFPYPPPDISNG